MSTARRVSEWIGKTPDSRPPPHVRVRIFETHNGICHRSGRRIRPGEAWECDHVIAIINGGENRESNMAPILKGKPHKEKTAEDVAEKSMVYRKKARHWGVSVKRKKIQSRGFEKAQPQRSASRPVSKWRGF